MSDNTNRKPGRPGYERYEIKKIKQELGVKHTEAVRIYKEHVSNGKTIQEIAFIENEKRANA